MFIHVYGKTEARSVGWDRVRASLYSFFFYANKWYDREACGFVMRNKVDDSGSELDFEAMEEYGRLQTNTIVSDVTIT